MLQQWCFTNQSRPLSSKLQTGNGTDLNVIINYNLIHMNENGISQRQNKVSFILLTDREAMITELKCFTPANCGLRKSNGFFKYLKNYKQLHFRVTFRVLATANV
jgi:hypothetical protein